MSRLFESTSINSMNLKNRFVRSATNEILADDEGRWTQVLQEYLVTLAEGEVGLIISGAAYVNPIGKSKHGQLGIHDQSQIRGLQQISEAVHAHGARFVVQLAHAGCDSPGEIIGTLPICPSARGEEIGRPCREMSEEDIRDVISDFANAAWIAKTAGADGVQLHAAHGFLLSQFLSPYFNKRRDRYGGNLENRGRIVREIIKAVRERTGPDFPVLIKINCDDYLEGGFSVDDMISMAHLLEIDGIDAVEISGGTFVPGGRYTGVRKGNISPDQEGYYIDAARRFKQSVKTPLILVGGIRSFDIAEDMVSRGISDYISLCRPLICEPHLIRRWQSGDLSPSRCMSDNLCLQSVFTGKGLRCPVFEK